ncbi:phosphatase PAP2-related protein [Legionella sp. W05-934-2]|uniref:phosphatase PAP2-related protein n=1 Tax=Legionella sp. W05-934-2 TaxID=1198649 RepID=UPI0034632D94
MHLLNHLIICLTHLGIPPNHLSIPGTFSSLLHFSGDMFFSGHVGWLFLLYLIFYPMKRCRRVFLSVSVLFGLSVVLGHIHYSIDVFSAPFMTFTIFHMSKWLFRSDWLLLNMTMKRLLLKP